MLESVQPSQSMDELVAIKEQLHQAFEQAAVLDRVDLALDLVQVEVEHQLLAFYFHVFSHKFSYLHLF